MKYNGQCYLWIPSNLTLSVLDAAGATLINNIHTAIGDPRTTYVAGDANPYIMALNDLDIGGAPFTRGVGSELAVCGPISNRAFLSINYIILIIAFGGEVEGYHMWLEVSDLQQEIPGSNPRFNKIVNNETVRMKWIDLDAGYSPAWSPLINGKYYRGTEIYNFPGNSGQPLNASEWLELMQNNVSVLTQAQKDIAVPNILPF